MPEALRMIEAPPALTRTTPPEAGVSGASLRASIFRPVVAMTMFCPGGMGAGPLAAAGTSAAEGQNPPVQIGRSILPPSNSTQTEEPIGGTTKTPDPKPAAGTH